MNHRVVNVMLQRPLVGCEVGLELRLRLGVIGCRELDGDLGFQARLRLTVAGARSGEKRAHSRVCGCGDGIREVHSPQHVIPDRVPRREVRRRDGDGGLRQVADFNLRLDLRLDLLLVRACVRGRVNIVPVV